MICGSLMQTLTYNVESFLSITKLHSNIGLWRAYLKYRIKMLSGAVVEPCIAQHLVDEEQDSHEFSPSLGSIANAKSSKDICQNSV